MLRYIATVGIKGFLGRDHAQSDIDLATPEHDTNARKLARTRRRLVADLVRIREERGFSQSQVASAIGIHRSGVCKFEADGATANPTLEVLLRYAHAVQAAIEIEVHKAEEPPRASHFVILESVLTAPADTALRANHVRELDPAPVATVSSLWPARYDEFAAR